LVTAAGNGAGLPERLPEPAGSGAFCYSPPQPALRGTGLQAEPRPPSDSAFRVRKVVVAALSSAIRDWTMAQACYATGENHERAVL